MRRDTATLERADAMARAYGVLPCVVLGLDPRSIPAAIVDAAAHELGRRRLGKVELAFPVVDLGST